MSYTAAEMVAGARDQKVSGLDGPGVSIALGAWVRGRAELSAKLMGF